MSDPKTRGKQPVPGVALPRPHKSRAGQLISHAAAYLEAYPSVQGGNWWTVWLVFQGMDGNKSTCLAIGDVELSAATIGSGQPQSAVNDYHNEKGAQVFVRRCAFNLSFSDPGGPPGVLHAAGEIAMHLKFCNYPLEVLPAKGSSMAQSGFMGELTDVFAFALKAVHEQDSRHDLRLEIQRRGMHEADSYSLGPVYLAPRLWSTPQIGSRYSANTAMESSGLTQCDFSLWMQESKGIVHISGELRPRWVIGSLDMILDGVRRPARTNDKHAGTARRTSLKATDI